MIRKKLLTNSDLKKKENNSRTKESSRMNLKPRYYMDSEIYWRISSVAARKNMKFNDFVKMSLLEILEKYEPTCVGL